jgi:putative zinc finger/helix-turn-helix YgiT family protein
MTDRCARCRSLNAALPSRIEVTKTIGGTTFTAIVQGRRCTHCGAEAADPRDVETFHLHVALHLAEAGCVGAEEVRFFRSVLRLRTQRLADMLDVAPETVSRWEAGRRKPSTAPKALLALMVSDTWSARGHTVECLSRLKRRRPLPAKVQLDVCTLHRRP